MPWASLKIPTEPPALRAPVLRRLLTTVVIPVILLFLVVSLLELSAERLPQKLQAMIRQPSQVLNTGLGVILVVAVLSWLLGS